MGLEGKRAAAKVRAQFIPDFEQRIEQACRFPVKLDLDWESYAEEPAVLEESQSAFFTVMTALKDVCKDDLGQGLAREAIKDVRVSNAGTGDFSARLEGGTVSVSFPRGGAASVGYSSQLAKAIGDGL